jgi:Exopolyphosphatase-related proteins
VGHRKGRVALVIYEINQNTCRINFRSKGNITVNNIAKSFGGGGHAFASGAVVNEPLETAKKIVINNSKNMVKDQIEDVK